MRKVHLVCSLLLAFSASVIVVGCDASKPASNPSMTGPAPSDAATPKGEAAKTDGKKATGKKKSSGSSSTTGGGVEVPAAGGATEKPEEKTDAKPEEKTESKPEEKKAE